MKDFLTRMIANKKQEHENLSAAMIDSESKEERAAIGESLKKIAEEIAEAEEKLAELDEPAEEQPAQEEGRALDIVAATARKEDMEVEKMENKSIMEERANGLAASGKMIIENNEARAVLVSSGALATPTEVGGINDIIGARVSSIIDMVKITDASGMGAYKVAYQISDAAAGTQTEGEAYKEGEPTFGFVEIKPQTEAVIGFVSKQTRKQTPLTYAAKVNESAMIGLRKRAAEIVTAKIVASDLNTEVTLSAIDATTLRKIALGYGGDESVVGAATLFINKKDLVKLGDVRGTNEKKALYEIIPDAGNPNTGIIKEGGLSVPYCLNSNLAEGTLIYGQPRCCELALFSNYEIAVSEDYAFNKGLLTIRGDVELGADVVVAGGFVKATVTA